MTDAFDDLDAITLDVIGDPITYTAGGTPRALKAWVNYAPAVQDFGASVAAVSDQPTMQIRKIDVPAPSKSDTAFLPRTGLTYRPMFWTHSKCGRLWDMTLSKAI